MRRGISGFAFQALLLALIAIGSASDAVAQTPVRIMPLGDSITSSPGCWRAYLWNRLQTAGHTNIDFVGSGSDFGGCNPGFTYDFDNEGHSGFSITGIADQNQLPPWLTAARPDIVVTHLGTNDMWGGHIPLQNKITALTKLIGQMRANNPNMKIIVAQIIPMDASGCTTCMSDVTAFNSALPAWAAGLTTAQSPIVIVDQWTGFDVVADTFDRVHPVTSGFIKMGDRFFPSVSQALGGVTPGVGLTVTRAGAGSGTVTSSPAGINCGTTCSASFSNGTSVTLTAAPASGSTFAGWSGACTGTSACTVSMTQSRSVTATFNTAATLPLAITRTGTGAGTVTSSPAGINCGTTCTGNFATGASVTLSAAATSGSTFAGWSGACTGTAATCNVSMTQARNVTATFNSVTTFGLSVTRAGAGTGAVTSNPAGINCGTTCAANYASGTSVTLTALPASNSTFAGWSGACTGTGNCTLSMTQARSVTATFNSMSTLPLTVTKAGTGAGTVTSAPAGINCGTTCSASFGGNASVTLTAAAAAGSTFAGWSGSCTGTGSCVLTMSQARAVTATFNTNGGTGGTCPNPVTFAGNSGNFNTTGAVCYRTNATINGWGCYNFDGRTLTVGGVARTCGQMPVARAADGYYYFAVTAGQFPWAGLFAW